MAISKKDEIDLIKKSLKSCIKNLTIYLNCSKIKLEISYKRADDFENIDIKEIKENIL